MNKPLHTGRLVLTPVDPYFLPQDPAAILDRLRQLGLVDGALTETEGHYLLGTRFMQLVTFMGCSPFIRLEPGEPEEPFCHLIVKEPTAEPKLLTGNNTRPPRCAACRKRLDDWRERLAGRLVTCPHCGHQQDPATYDFRQTAGWGRLFLFIENIFPQEAIPSPELLDGLATASGGEPWHHFYQQD